MYSLRSAKRHHDRNGDLALGEPRGFGEADDGGFGGVGGVCDVGCCCGGVVRRCPDGCGCVLDEPQGNDCVNGVELEVHALSCVPPFGFEVHGEGPLGVADCEPGADGSIGAYGEIA